MAVRSLNRALVGAIAAIAAVVVVLALTYVGQDSDVALEQQLHSDALGSSLHSQPLPASHWRGREEVPGWESHRWETSDADADGDWPRYENHPGPDSDFGSFEDADFDARVADHDEWDEPAHFHEDGSAFIHRTGPRVWQREWHWTPYDDEPARPSPSTFPHQDGYGSGKPVVGVAPHVPAPSAQDVNRARYNRATYGYYYNDGSAGHQAPGMSQRQYEAYVHRAMPIFQRTDAAYYTWHDIITMSGWREWWHSLNHWYAGFSSLHPHHASFWRRAWSTCHAWWRGGSPPRDVTHPNGLDPLVPVERHLADRILRMWDTWDIRLPQLVLPEESTEQWETLPPEPSMASQATNAPTTPATRPQPATIPTETPMTMPRTHVTLPRTHKTLPRTHKTLPRDHKTRQPRTRATTPITTPATTPPTRPPSTKPTTPATTPPPTTAATDTPETPIPKRKSFRTVWDLIDEMDLKKKVKDAKAKKNKRL